MAKIIQLRSGDWYQLRISLKNIAPEIWRRFLVESDIKLPELHKVIQTVMGWTNSHQHQFIIDGRFYCEPHEDSFTETVDYREIKLNQVFSDEGKKVYYEYDFGDGWEHEIELERILHESTQKYTACLDGRGNCPPEDCGGPYGYEDLMKIISDPDGEGYSEMIEWLGDDFDPDHFDIKEINEMLKEKDFGCITLY